MDHKNQEPERKLDEEAVQDRSGERFDRIEETQEYDDGDVLEDEDSNVKGKLKVILVTVLVVLLLFGGTVGGIYLYVMQNLKPVEASAEEVDITIPKGASAKQIGEILEEHGLIRNAKIFYYYARLKGTGTNLQAGDYRLKPGMEIDEILEKFAKGEVYMETFTFTIPEGLTVPQIANLLADKGYVNKEAFLKEVNEGRFDYEFLKEIPANQDRKYRLEGYLFPETYEMKKGATEHEIIDRMLKQFDSVISDEWRSELKKRNMTLDQAVILASIVEREAVLDDERPIIAGVFYNRMNNDWLLQSCATVQYVLDKHRDVITYADLEVESPYNTYKHEGLPPGPIANPGKASLQAVIYPDQNDYFFFVTKKDGSNGHLFSKTYEEHKKNDAKSRGSW